MGKTRLRKLDMSSVDFVRRGANQKADIMLRKSAEDEEIPQGLWKSIQDAVKEWRKGEDSMKEFQITKSSFVDALDYSMDSIIADETMDNVAKAEMAEESIQQFSDALLAEVKKAIGYEAPEDDMTDEGEEGEENNAEEEKNQPEPKQDGQKDPENPEEGEKTMKIDKSRFNSEELKQYKALIEKAKVDEEEEYELPPEEEETEKADEELHPEVKRALAEVENLKKSLEMKNLHDVAKKYSVIGKKEDELAETLYAMKKSSPEAYNNFVALLDEQVDMVEKSGVFTEIGKSGHGGYAGGSTVSKINSIASEIQKADPGMSRFDAIAKAWDSNPELLAEYERTYTE